MRKVAKRCAGKPQNGGPCGNWAVGGSQHCRWHNNAQYGLLRFTPPAEPVSVPKPCCLTLDAALVTPVASVEAAWYQDLLQEIEGSAVRTGRREQLQALLASPGFVTAKGDAADRLPPATLVIWRTTGLEIAIGTDRVLGAAEVVDCLSLHSGLEMVNHFFRSEDFPIAQPLAQQDGDEFTVRLRDGSDDPYLCIIRSAGKWMIAASPNVPRREYGPSGIGGAKSWLPDTVALRSPSGEWRQHQPRPPRCQIAAAIPQSTSPEVRTVNMAITDPKRWVEMAQELALIYCHPKEPFQVKLEPSASLIESLAGEATYEALWAELRVLGFWATILLQVVLNFVSKEHQATVAMDDLIQAIGWKPRTTMEREQMSALIWRGLLLLDSVQVHGVRRGDFFDSFTRERLDLTSCDALVRIMGRRGLRNNDPNAAPLEVTLAAGPWLNRLRENRQVVTDFGDVRRIADIPAGQPYGAWAQGIGTGLQQRWREYAREADVECGEDGEPAFVRFHKPFTRGDLFGLFRCQPSVEDVLSSKHPKRAQDYWNEAVRKLEEIGVVGICQSLAPLSEKRQGWQQEWLDQPLNIQPTAQGLRDIAAISKKRVQGGKPEMHRKRRAA